jgi:8-oxo-dGTP pyrophosphatase MutT (NUDIX family)
MAIRRLSTRTVYENRWLSVREDEIARADGSTGVYGVVDKPDFALIIPLDRGGFHLVEQYRYAVSARSSEFPQGTLPDRQDGDPAELARRELLEEAGLDAGRLEHLGYMYQGPGHSSQGMNVFLATELSPGTPRREPEEQDMQQRWVTRDRLEEMIRSGDIRDSSTVAAYALLLLHER